MSFSADVKKQLCSIENECSECDRAELCGIFEFAGNVKNGSMKLVTENENVADKIIFLLKKCFGIDIEYVKRELAYSFVINDINVLSDIAEGIRLFEINEEKNSKKVKPCCVLAYVRGAFLGGGSVTDPEKGYHLEFSSKFENITKKLCTILKSMDFNAKTIYRKGNYIAYIKECEVIADILGAVGAGLAVLTLYNVQIEKEMRNSVNRQVNCETANLDKVIKASLRQIDAIKKIERVSGLDKLPDTLFQMAKIRLEYPEESLKELSERMKLGKSGVNHRLNRLIEIADELEDADLSPKSGENSRQR